MADNVQNEVTAVLKRIGGAWGWLLAFGILAVAAGVCMFFFTGAALFVIADAFGVFLIFSGAFGSSMRSRCRRRAAGCARCTRCCPPSPC